MSVSTGGGQAVGTRHLQQLVHGGGLPGKKGFAVSTEGTKCGKGWYL